MKLFPLFLLVFLVAACSGVQPTVSRIDKAPPGELATLRKELETVLRKSPQEHLVLSRLARVLFRLGKREQAETLAVSASHLAPFDVENGELLGEIYLAGKKVFRALAAFNRVVLVEPKQLTAYVGLARSYYLIGTPQPALAALKRALGRDATFFPAHYQMALILFETGEKEAALKALETAELTQPHSPEVLLLRMRMKKEEGRFAAARMLAEEALLLRPGFPEVLAELVEIHFQRGEWPQALALLDQLPKEGRPRAELVRVEVFFAMGKAAEAEALLDKVTAKYPGNIPARLMRARHLLDQGHPAKALPLLETAVELQPNGSEGFLLKAIAHFELEQIPLGEAALESAARLAGRNMGVRLLQARRMMARGELSVAGTALSTLSKEYPQNLAVALTKAELLALQGNFAAAETTLAGLLHASSLSALRFARARLAHLRRASQAVLKETGPLMAVLPVPWQVAFLHASALGRLKRVEEALAVLAPMLEKGPGRGALFWLAGKLHLLKGDKNAAVKVYDKGLRIFPRHLLLTDALTRLDLESGRIKAAQRRLETIEGIAGPLRPLFLERLIRIDQALKNQAGALRNLERYREYFDPFGAHLGPEFSALLAESPYPVVIAGNLSSAFLLRENP